MEFVDWESPRILRGQKVLGVYINDPGDNPLTGYWVRLESGELWFRNGDEEFPARMDVEDLYQIRDFSTGYDEELTVTHEEVFKVLGWTLTRKEALVLYRNLETYLSGDE